MYEMNKIYNEDCLTGMQNIADKSIDMILCDLPYGTTACAWDTIIPFDKLWQCYERIIKNDGSIVLFGSQPFTSKLVMSKLEWFKYEWIWEKSKATGYLNAKKQPMKAHEDIVVFYEKQCKYNPQMTKGEPYNKGCAVRNTMAYGKQEKAILVKNDTGLRYPRTVQYFVTAESEGKLHPTQKPVELCEYLIKTYTNENEIVLDNCMGSGTTAIACLKTKRNYIGFELDKEYYDLAQKRINDFTAQGSFLC